MQQSVTIPCAKFATPLYIGGLSRARGKNKSLNYHYYVNFALTFYNQVSAD